MAREVSHSQSKKSTQGNDRMSDWECIGPWDWDHDAAGRSYAPGSAHVYTVEQSISNAIDVSTLTSADALTKPFCWAIPRPIMATAFKPQIMIESRIFNIRPAPAGKSISFATLWPVTPPAIKQSTQRASALSAIHI